MQKKKFLTKHQLSRYNYFSFKMPEKKMDKLHKTFVFLVHARLSRACDGQCRVRGVFPFIFLFLLIPACNILHAANDSERLRDESAHCRDT